MPNNNPDGYNAFGGPMDRQPGYGDIARLANLSKLAATAQPTSLNAPKRAQRKAVNGGRSRPSPTPAAASAAPPTEAAQPYAAVLGGFWSELAAEPGASPLILEIAQAARGR